MTAERLDLRACRTMLIVSGECETGASAWAAADAVLLETGRETVRLAREVRRHIPEAPLAIVLPQAAGEMGEAELAALLEGGPDSVVLSGAVGPGDVEGLAAALAVWEAETGRPDGSTGILARIDTAAGALALPGFRADVPRRLVALLCSSARIADAIGCGPNAPAVVEARALCVLAAAAAGIPAILDLGGTTVSEVALRSAFRDGFRAVAVGEPGEVARVRAALPAG